MSIKSLSILFLLYSLGAKQVNAQLKQTVYNEQQHSLELKFDSFPEGTERIELTFIDIELQEAGRLFGRTRGKNYFFSSEYHYVFKALDSSLLTKDVAPTPSLFRINYIDSNENSVQQRVYRKNGAKNTVLINFDINQIKFKQAYLDSISSSSFPYGFWEFDYDYINTYFRGKKQLGVIQNFSGSNVISADKLSSKFQLIAYHDSWPDVEIFTLHDSISMQVGKSVVKKLYHPDLNDSIRLEVKASLINNVDHYITSSWKDSSRIWIEAQKDTLWNGILLRKIRLGVANGFPENRNFSIIRGGGYITQPSKKINYILKSWRSVNLAPGTSFVDIAFPAKNIKPGDSITFSLSESFKDRLICSLAIGLKAVDSIPSYKVTIFTKPNWRITKRMLIYGNHNKQVLNKWGPTFERSESFGSQGWTGCIFAGETITLTTMTKHGEVTWSGIPEFDEKNRYQLKLETSGGKWIKIVMDKTEL